MPTCSRCWGPSAARSGSFSSAGAPKRIASAVVLATGETRRVEFALGPDELRYWHPLDRDWMIDAATVDVWVGGDATAALGVIFEITEE